MNPPGPIPLLLLGVASTLALAKAAFHGIVAGNPRVAEDIAKILALRREALVQAEGDVTNRFEADGGRDRSTRILEKIRGYFGL